MRSTDIGFNVLDRDFERFNRQIIAHGAETPNYHFFRGEPAEFRSPLGVASSVLSGCRRGLIQLGLLLLIATPVVRVACSLLAFLPQRDFTYALITLLVLAGLISFRGTLLT